MLAQICVFLVMFPIVLGLMVLFICGIVAAFSAVFGSSPGKGSPTSRHDRQGLGETELREAAKMYSTHDRRETEERVLQQAIEYEASHGNELPMVSIKVARRRLHAMTDTELEEAEEEMDSLEATV